MKFKVKTYRNHKDFKFANWRFEMQSDGGHIVYGRLKKTNQWSKYQEIYRVE